jgi:FKBP-type peptidyl-prolyl cis-trans isomerase
MTHSHPFARRLAVVAVAALVAAVAIAVAAPGGAAFAAGDEPGPTKVTGKPTVTASGLKYYEIKPGSGAVAESGDIVKVHYTGWLTNGTKFDSSLGRGEPLKFWLGKRQVIAGWDEGVAGMKVGGKRQLHIPAKLGYGAAGAGPTIPPNADLVFDVELVAVAK